MKKVIVGLLRFYQKFISPVFVAEFGHACKFTPTCSQYATRAVDENGVLKGGWMSLVRLSKCR